MTHLAIEHALLAVLAARGGDKATAADHIAHAQQQTRTTARRERQLVEIAALVVTGDIGPRRRPGARTRRAIPRRCRIARPRLTNRDSRAVNAASNALTVGMPLQSLERNACERIAFHRRRSPEVHSTHVASTADE